MSNFWQGLQDYYGERPANTISRIVIIDENGVEFTNDSLEIELIDIQDLGRTLKIFIKNTKTP